MSPEDHGKAIWEGVRIGEGGQRLSRASKADPDGEARPVSMGKSSMVPNQES